MIRFLLLLLFIPFLIQAQAIHSMALEADELGKSFTKKIFNRAMVIGVYHNGNDTILSNGRINFLGRKADENDIFQIGSVTKTFTTLMLAKEIEKGSFTLGESISPYLDVKNKEKYDSVTFEHLVTHTSGLPSNTIVVHGPSIGSYVGLTYLTNGILKAVSAPQIFISLPWQIVAFSPPIGYFSIYGRKSLNMDLRHARLKKYGEWKYSNVGIGVIGNILSQSSELSYEDLLQREILEPLGMNNTSTNAKKLPKGKFATPHNLFGMKMPRTNMKKGGMEGAGNIKSTATDMMKYLKLQLENSNALSEIAQKQHKSLFKSKREKSKGLEMGMGWIKYVTDDHPTVIWHNGQVTGSSSFIGFIPEKDIGIFILTNKAKSGKLAKMGFRYLRKMSQQIQ